MARALKTIWSEPPHLKLMKLGDMNHVKKNLFDVCLNKNYYSFYNGSFKIQGCPLSCNSEKVLYLLKCKVCDEASYVGKAKTKFWYRFNNYKTKHRAFRKGNRKKPQELFNDHYCLDSHLKTGDWDFTLFEQCETQKQLKERESF